MGTTEWFRNASWSEVVAAQFEVKLARARRKEQYLRIQASTLASVEPDVAHKLLDRYLALPDLVAMRCLQEQYARAIEILEKHKSPLMFPLDPFKWNAAMALILRARGDRGSARSFAGQALTASKVGTSGFRHHPHIGLVRVACMSVIERLNTLHDA